ncbi:MAG: hypothetical protein ACHP7N_07645 [Caulobacterales bacterium]
MKTAAARAGLGLVAAAFAWAAWASAWADPPPATNLSAVKAHAQPAKSAESGARETAATSGPLAIGATVKDRDGVTLGHITRLTTDKAGVSVAQVRLGEDVLSIPVSDLFMKNGEVLSTLTRDELKRSAQP